MASRDEWMISVDSHLIEPPTVWLDRLPAKHREQGPRWISDEHGESWLFEGSKRIPVDAMSTNGAVYPPENRAEMFRPLAWSEIPPACYDPAARIEAMNTDHELAALCFANMSGFAGSLFQRAQDKDLALLCIQAYNDWFLEEWVDAYPGRFIGLALIPMWDGKLAAAEAERAIAKGARSVSFSQAPHVVGFPRIDDESWAPLFSVMNEAGLPICTHLGTGMSPAEEDATADWSKRMREAMENNDLDKLAEQMAKESGSRRPMRRNLRPGTSTSVIGAKMGHETLMDWFDSAVLERYPELRLVLSENGVGWIPSVLSLADWTEELNRAGDAAEEARPLPSQVFQEHVYGCFIDEPIRPKLLDELGVDHIMVETDFPHTATNWPHSMERVDVCLQGLSDEARRKILRGNAERVFDFVPVEPPVPVG